MCVSVNCLFRYYVLINLIRVFVRMTLVNQPLGAESVVMTVCSVIRRTFLFSSLVWSVTNYGNGGNI